MATISFDLLPDDMLWEIAKWLDPESYLQMQTTCKRSNDALRMEYRRAEYRRMNTVIDHNASRMIIKFWKHRHAIWFRKHEPIGNKFWYRDGKTHRDNDKPAVEYATGTKLWYRNGKQHRDNDKPAVEHADGTKWWYRDGKCHRDDDKPAIEYANGDKEWYCDGKLHRDHKKPAAEYANGIKEWVDGEFVRREN